MKIDEWMPEYQLSASYSIVVHTSAERAYTALLVVGFADLRLVRGLMRLRGYRLGGETIPASEATEQRRPFGSFLELAALPRNEVLLGIVGKFWSPDGGIIRGLTPEEFRLFNSDGYAKVLWNFSLAAVSGGTKISTETRVQTFGRWATVKFRLYWLAIGPFSGLMRKVMLREVKRVCEQTG